MARDCLLSLPKAFLSCGLRPRQSAFLVRPIIDPFGACQTIVMVLRSAIFPPGAKGMNLKEDMTVKVDKTRIWHYSRKRLIEGGEGRTAVPP